MFSSKADSPLHKLIDYWNFSMFNRLDIVMILMALLGFGLRMGSYINRDLFIPAKTLYSLNCVLFFLRLLRLYSANSNLGPKLVMIKLMVSNNGFFKLFASTWQQENYRSGMIFFLVSDF